MQIIFFKDIRIYTMYGLIIYLFLTIKIFAQSNWIPDHTNILPDGKYGIFDYWVHFINRVTVED